MGLKVAMITPWGKVRCGIRTYSEQLINALAECGVDCYVVRLPRFGRKSTDLLQQVVDQIPVDKVDVIHCQHEYGLYQRLDVPFFQALHRLDKPTITTMHAVGQFAVDSLIASVSDRVIVHNNFCERRFSHPDKTVIVPHGCSPVECPPKEECKEKLGVDARIPLVGYLGFITNYKGLETLIEAMIKIPRTGLLMGGGYHTTGDTTYIVKLKEWTLKVLPARCQWLGYVPNEKLATVYGSLDCFVYPSRFATESGALLTALSHGCPTIASRLAPFKEKEKQKALITFKDVKDLRRKIRKVLKDKKVQDKLRQGAKHYAVENSWQNVALKHVELYQEIA